MAPWCHTLLKNNISVCVTRFDLREQRYRLPHQLSSAHTHATESLLTTMHTRAISHH